MTATELKVLEDLSKKFSDLEMDCYRQMSWCKEHNFNMEREAIQYKQEAYGECRLELMFAIDKINGKS